MQSKQPFNIRDWLDFNKSNRAACPACTADGKIKQHNLALTAKGAYFCWRGCTSDQIREALGVPKGRLHITQSSMAKQIKPTSHRTVSEQEVHCSQWRLFEQGEI
jgi:hypothetical protein